MKNRKEIRIVNPNEKLFKQMKELAKINKRTLGKQAEFMLEKCLKNPKNESI